MVNETSEFRQKMLSELEEFRFKLDDFEQPFEFFQTMPGTCAA